LCMILCKIKVISNTKLKDIGIMLFLSNLNENELKNKFNSYHKKIDFNDLFANLNFDSKNNYIIISASFQDYIHPIFPNFVQVFGSTIKYVNRKPKKTLFNCYKENKVTALNNNNITKIDVFYTDSFSDFSLAKLAKEIIIVKNNNLIKCTTIDEFKTHFKQ